jgi:hypothetical protein
MYILFKQENSFPQWAFKENSAPASSGKLAFKNIVC